MSTVISPLPSAADDSPVARATAPRADVIIANRIAIPGWINNLEKYRCWTQSDEYPEIGWISYVNGTIFVDTNLEEFLSHNRVKQAFNTAFGVFLMQHPLGCFIPDRMLLVNESANLSTEPDGLFYLWQTMQLGRLRLIVGKSAGFTQLEGTPDCVLEIVSDSSETKDLIALRESYWNAQIPEYWLVDARRDSITFDILRHAAKGYQATPVEDGCVRSEILGQSFRIERTVDPLGLAQFVVHVKP
jgi:Uma2 family endonuclease